MNYKVAYALFKVWSLWRPKLFIQKCVPRTTIFQGHADWSLKPYNFTFDKGHCSLSQYHYTTFTQFFAKSCIHLKITGARRVAWNKFRTKAPKILSTNFIRPIVLVPGIFASLQNTTAFFKLSSFIILRWWKISENPFNPILLYHVRSLLTKPS